MNHIHLAFGNTVCLDVLFIACKKGVAAHQVELVGQTVTQERVNNQLSLSEASKTQFLSMSSKCNAKYYIVQLYIIFIHIIPEHEDL